MMTQTARNQIPPKIPGLFWLLETACGPLNCKNSVVIYVQISIEL